MRCTKSNSPRRDCTKPPQQETFLMMRADGLSEAANWFLASLQDHLCITLLKVSPTKRRRPPLSLNGQTGPLHSSPDKRSNFPYHSRPAFGQKKEGGCVHQTYSQKGPAHAGLCFLSLAIGQVRVKTLTVTGIGLFWASGHLSNCWNGMGILSC